jgi:hypothetical protein
MQQRTHSDDPIRSDQFSGLEQRILAALDGLQFGAVEITVHEGKVVQIERREKFRFPSQTKK